jgi:hypothetical protein
MFLFHSGNKILKKFSLIHCFEENEPTFIENWHNLEDFRVDFLFISLKDQQKTS